MQACSSQPVPRPPARARFPGNPHVVFVVITNYTDYYISLGLCKGFELTESVKFCCEHGIYVDDLMYAHVRREGIKPKSIPSSCSFSFS